MQKDTAVRLNEVDRGALFEVLPFGKERGEKARDIRVNFKAAFPDGRTDGGEYVFRMAVLLDAHALQRPCGDAAQSASPPGMHGGDYLLFGVGKKDRNAVGSFYRYRLPGTSGNESVTFAARHPFGGIDDVVGVNLLQQQRLTGKGRLNGAETVTHPREPVQQRRTIVPGSVEIQTHAAGFFVCATITWRLNSSSMVSSRRTSVGRLTSVIWSILSCSFSNP